MLVIVTVGLVIEGLSHGLLSHLTLIYNSWWLIVMEERDLSCHNTDYLIHWKLLVGRWCWDYIRFLTCNWKINLFKRRYILNNPLLQIHNRSYHPSLTYCQKHSRELCSTWWNVSNFHHIWKLFALHFLTSYNLDKLLGFFLRYKSN